MKPALTPASPSVPTLRYVIPIVIAINAAVLWLLRDQVARFAFSPHAPDWALLARQNFMVQVHLFAALSALMVALFMLKGAKGTRAHRIVGWAWVVLMMTTALSSFFVRELNHGALSWIHILSGWTALAAPLAVWAARTRRVRLHQRLMMGLVLGGLFGAGALSFIPGRLLYRVFIG